MLLAGRVIHADETDIQVLHEKGRKATTKSKMWVWCSGKFDDRRINIFDYHPTRKGEHAAEFLKGFNGYVVCDGYDACNAIVGAIRYGCWAHVRRKFVEVIPKEKTSWDTSTAVKAVKLCNDIYHEERKLAELPPEEREEQRLVKVKPLLEAFFAWLETLQVSGKSKLAGAVGYALHEAGI